MRGVESSISAMTGSDPHCKSTAEHAPSAAVEPMAVYPSQETAGQEAARVIRGGVQAQRDLRVMEVRAHC